MPFEMAHAFEREMYVIKAQEHLELVNLMAASFGSLDGGTRKELLDSIAEQAEIKPAQVGIDLAKLKPNERAAVFAQFGIPVG
jgi:hypothetical protein